MSENTNMTLVHLSKMDLNLLLALDALVEERSVTLAAVRLGLTQSATSRALSRLRMHFDDPLLVRTGRGMLLSPRAQALAGPLREALIELEATVGTRASFEPSTAERTFHIGTVDYPVAVVLPPLLCRLQNLAPRIRVVVHPIRDDLNALLESGVVELAIAPKRASSPGLVWTQLFSESMVTLARGDHPKVGKTLSLAAFCALSHVLVSPEGRSGSVVDEALARLGKKRHIALTVGSFLAAPLVVADSDLLVTTAARIAHRFADLLSLRVLIPPVEIPRFTLSMVWHERFRKDPAHVWFRDLVREVGRTDRQTATGTFV